MNRSERNLPQLLQLENAASYSRDTNKQASAGYTGSDLFNTDYFMPGLSHFLCLSVTQEHRREIVYADLFPEKVEMKSLCCKAELMAKDDL